MREATNDHILDSAEPARLVAQHFSKQLDLLQSLIAYGTHLIPRCLVGREKTLTDAVVLGGLVKHVVSMLDGAEILTRSAAVFAAQLQARSLFESSVYITWILKEDVEQRARYYRVGDLRKELLWARRVQGGTKEAEAYERAFRDVGRVMEPSAELRQTARDQEQEILKVLARGENVQANAAFDRTKGRRGFDRPWYTALGIQDLGKLADAVGRLPEYVLIYSPGSEVTHAAALRRHLRIDATGVHLTPIRHLEGIETLIRVLVIASLQTYRDVLEYYRPAELSSFSRKYAEEWRIPFRYMPTVKYDESGASSITL